MVGLCIRNTTNFLIPSIYYLSRIWQNILEFWVLNALQEGRKTPEGQSTLYFFGFLTISI